jgi:hypothetical protein
LIVCEGRRHAVLPAGAARAWPPRAQEARGYAAVSLPAAPSTLRVSTACGGGGLIAAVAAGTPVPPDSLLATCHRERVAVRGVEKVSLGRLQGRFRIEAICPGRGFARHVYALLHPI